MIDLNTITHGDSLTVLRTMSSSSVDFIFTSPPYADNRKSTYKGVPIDQYVSWFLAISAELKRVLRPQGTFILNIKERAANGERQTYVLELILAMKKQGWLWTEEFIWHKKTAILANGRTVSETHGNDASNLINKKNSECSKKR